jgi:hypothetical protein
MDKPAQVLKLFSDSKVQCDNVDTYGITFNIICDPNANRLESSDFIISDDRCRP